MYHSRFTLHASMVGIDYVLTHRVELQVLPHIHLTEKCKQSVSFQVSSTSQSFRQPFWKLACRPHPHSTTPVKVWSLHEYFEKKNTEKLHTKVNGMNTKWSLSSSIQCAHPLFFFSPFCTHSILFPSHCTSDCWQMEFSVNLVLHQLKK